MLGTAGESLGMDRQLKSNTSKTRTHSLFRQGCMLYELIPNMPEHRLRPLMQRFATMLISSGLLGGFLSGMNETKQPSFNKPLSAAWENLRTTL